MSYKIIKEISSTFQKGFSSWQLTERLKLSPNIKTEFISLDSYEEIDECRIVYDSEPSSSELDAIEDIISEHIPSSIGDKRYCVQTYWGNKLITETWYQVDNGDDTYSEIVEETTYNYIRNNLVSTSLQRYLINGHPYGVAEIWEYFTNGTKKIKKRRQP